VSEEGGHAGDGLEVGHGRWAGGLDALSLGRMQKAPEQPFSTIVSDAAVVSERGSISPMVFGEVLVECGAVLVRAVVVKKSPDVRKLLFTACSLCGKY
jgi:hypothetical protein